MLQENLLHIIDKDKPFWYVILSNGTTIYENNNTKTNSWILLKRYCKRHKLYINKMYIRFRSHVEEVISEPCCGVFFRMGILASPSPKMKNNKHLYVIGSVQENHIDITTYYVPELLVESTETRKLYKHRGQIIWNPNMVAVS